MKRIFFISFLILCFECAFAQKIFFEFDKLNRLIKAGYESNISSISYRYDSNGNRNVCIIVGVVTSYVFIGNGNWSNASNWQNNTIPPIELPVGSEIIIDPLVNGECILDVNQKIMIGAKIRVMAGKKLRIPANINFQ